VIGHAKLKQYHEMMSVKNVHRDYAAVFERTSEAWHYHESSQSTTDRKEGH